MREGRYYRRCKLTLSATTQRRSVDKLSQLFEQGAEANCIAKYCQRFASWASGGLGKTTVSLALTVETLATLTKEYTQALTLLPDSLLPRLNQNPVSNASITT